jgi:putative tryptophan/tyrosine transport system substrate-binding protein
MTVGKSAQSLRRAGHRITRRELLLLLAGATTVPRALHSQQNTMPLIGFLGVTREATWFMDPFRQGLRETGYIDGNNVAMEYRVAQFQYDRLPTLAADLVSRKVDLIVTTNGTPAALAAKSATSTIPIVFTYVSDPVGMGLVASLARPGGNLTGFSNIAAELTLKEVELICQLVPQASVIALLVNQNSANAPNVIGHAQEAARAKGVQLAVFNAGTEREVDAAFASLVQLQAGALVVDPDGFFNSRRQQLLALAARHAVPTVYPRRHFVAAGGLISYGPVETAIPRQAGIYAGRILKGARPADLPVQQPTEFELVINLTTAKGLGLTIPPMILARADEVIE